MNSKAQRSRYLEIRQNNPCMRVRSDLNLGPRVTVDVQQTMRNSLELPDEWFVSLDIYQRDNPGVVVREDQKCWEFLEGKWIEGVPYIEIKLYFMIFVKTPYVVLM